MIRLPADVWARLQLWLAAGGDGEFVIRKHEGHVRGGSERSDFRISEQDGAVLLQEELRTRPLPPGL